MSKWTITAAMFSIFATAAASSASAQSGRAEMSRPSTPANSAEEAAQKIADILRARVVPLDRETFTFHYREARGEINAKTNADVINMVRGGLEQFYNQDVVSGDMQGPGLYAAVDPSSSRVFGRGNPLLFAVPLRKGARVLRLTGDVSSADYDRVKQIAKNLNCLPSERQFDGLEDVTRIFRGSDSPICRQIIIEAYHQLNVEAILYKYEADNYDHDCRLRTDAFNIISTQAVDLEKLSLFWDQGKIANQTTARFVSSAYKSAKSSFYRRYLIALGDPNYGMPNSLSDLKTFDRAAHSWKKKNLLRCGGDWSIEGQNDIDRKLNSSIQSWFADDETKAAIVAWIKMARAKINPDLGGPSAVQHISEIERAMFAVTVPNTPIKSQEFINWVLASDVQYSWQFNASQKEVQTAKLLNEQAPFARTTDRDSKFEEILKSLPATTVASADFSRTLMLAAGFGPKLTAIKINSMIAFAGGSPMILNGSIAENKREFVKIVRRCTEMMSAPGVTKEDIQGSSCSVRIPTY